MIFEFNVNIYFPFLMAHLVHIHIICLNFQQFSLASNIHHIKNHDLIHIFHQ